MGKSYKVMVGRVGQPVIETEAQTLKEARAQIEAHGSTQDYGMVYRGARLVATYRCGTTGKWYKTDHNRAADPAYK